MTIHQRRAYSPYPEIADPGAEGYHIIDSNEVGQGDSANTNKTDREMMVPLDVEGAEVARHEMGHARWSPTTRPDTEDMLADACVQAVEEARVNMGLARIGIPFNQPMRYGRELLELQLKAMLEGQFADALCRYVGVQGSNIASTFDEISERFIKQENDIAVWVDAEMKKFRIRMRWARFITRETVPTFARAMRIAQQLEKAIRDKCEEQGTDSELMKIVPTGKPSATDPMPNLGGTGQGMPVGMNLRDYYREAKLGETSKGLRDWEPKDSDFFSTTWGEAVPGDMKIHTPKLVIPLVRPDLERVTKARAAEEGTEIRYVERFVSDQRVFRRRAKQRKGGGTVLLDVSSTMELSDKDVQRIVVGAPEATKVATYCGNATNGLLSIVVDKGRRAEPRDIARRYGEGNNVDLHALDWLSCQPAPRVWYTDGGVTGKGHNTDKNYRDLCGAIVSENNIIQCANITQVCSALRREREDMAGVWMPRDEDVPGQERCGECEQYPDECVCCGDCELAECECEEEC